MRCPKCHQENPSDILFCENCDHRMDQPVRGEVTLMPPQFGSFIALALGILSVILYFFTDTWYWPVAAGALGLLLGSYSMAVIRKSPKMTDKRMLIAVAGAAMGLSVIGFMLGIASI